MTLSPSTQMCRLSFERLSSTLGGILILSTGSCLPSTGDPSDSFSEGKRRRNWLPIETHGTPPSRTVSCPAEYQSSDGAIIAWKYYPEAHTEFTVAATNSDPDATVYILVQSRKEQSRVSTVLAGAGARMDRVSFITYKPETPWIRDFGPKFIYESHIRRIVDHTYDSTRHLDNLFNDHLSDYLQEKEYQIPVRHSWGNFHAFANGDGFASSLILEKNPQHEKQEIADLFREYFNINLTILPRFPARFDGTGHIDMWMLPVSDDAVIIGEYTESTGRPFEITEAVAEDFTSRGYRVFRTPGWKWGNTHYSYTNAVILNRNVFVPRYGDPWSARDEEAMQVFRRAFPQHTIRSIGCREIIDEGGSLHCVVMHVPHRSDWPPQTAPQSPITAVEVASHHSRLDTYNFASR